MSTERRASPIERWMGYPVDAITYISPEFRLSARRRLEEGPRQRATEQALDLYRVAWLAGLILLLSIFVVSPRWLQVVLMAFAAFRALEVTFLGVRLFLLPSPDDTAPVLRYGRSATVAFMHFFVLVLSFAALYLGANGVSAEGVLLRGPVNAFYFSLVTITTLGYGDYSPCTTLAQVLVTLQLACGVLMVMAFIPPLVARPNLSEQAAQQGDADGRPLRGRR